METMVISVPDAKSRLVKELLKELGVEIKTQETVNELIDDINNSMKPGDVPTMEEIIEEINAYRAEKK